MKTLIYAVSAILLTASVAANAQPSKKDLIEFNQKQVHVEIDAIEKAKPSSEARPAAITSHKKHSVESPKATMIKRQILATNKSIDDALSAVPLMELRPAVTTAF